MEKRIKVMKRHALLNNSPELKDLMKDPSDCNNYNGSAGPLHSAAMNDSFDAAKLLLDNGLGIDAVSPQGTTPLHVAARHNSEAVAELLIRCGANRMALDASAKTPLMLAAELGHSSIVELLLRQDPFGAVSLELRDSVGNAALHLAAAGDHAEVANLLVSWKANLLALNDDGETAVNVAERCGSRRVLEVLVPRMPGSGHSLPADKQSDCSAMDLALVVLQNRIQDLREAELDQLAERTADGKTLLHWAVVRDSIDCVEYLLGAGLGADDLDATGAAPLHYAALNCADRCCAVLIDSGVIDSGVDVNRRETTLGLTPLMMAVDVDAVATARRLLGTGRLRLDLADRDGETALMHAARRSNEELTRLLLPAVGADAKLLAQKNSSGLSAIEISHLLGHRAVSELLEPYRPSLDVYPRRNPKNGYCLIINQIYRSNDLDNIRRGSEQDVKRIYQLFQTDLHFRVHERPDLDSEGMIAEMRKIANSGVLADIDYFVCFILAHGHGDAVQGTDGKLVELRDIALQVDAEHCPDLVGKPKVFFIQACRTRGDTGMQYFQSKPEPEDNAKKAPLKISKYIDFLFGFSTWEDCLSYRSIYRGSLYIQKLCDVIEENYDKMDLLKMMTHVCREVGSTPGPGKGSTCYMVPNIKSSLQKDFRF
uniref:ANK_REP_REGION domain-containing protein n=1 Tax=Macrostomum lignano TaxID=282301 RepID=A0A1I8GZW9_9PLAT